MPIDDRLDFLGPVDTAFYYVDTPKTPMNIGGITIFEGKIPFEDFFKFIDSRIYEIPLYQKRIVQAPYSLTHPRWMYDPAFDTRNHVFQHELDAPGDETQLRELAGHLVSGMLDRSKPLWQVHLINGLEGNQSAILFKVHHCMVDGLSAVELFTLLLEVAPGKSAPPRPKPIYVPPSLPSPLALITNALSQEIPQKWSLLKKLGDQALQMGSVLTDPDARRKTFVGVATLINDNLAPIQKLLINGENSGKLTLAWTEYPLDEVRAIRSANHASVNEVMLSVLGGGVGMYLTKHGETAQQSVLRVLAPVDVRTEDEKGTFGNRIAVLPIDVPLYEEDPLKRLQSVVKYSQTMKQSRLAMGVDMLLTLPSLALSVAEPLVWGAAPNLFAYLAHTWCTNVMGPPLPMYVLGHKMLATYGYFPLNASEGMASVILSYNGKISMTLVADAGIIPDVLEMRRCLDRAYAALRTASQIEARIESHVRVSAAPDPPPATVLSESEGQKPVTDLVVVEADLQIVSPDNKGSGENPTSAANGHDLHAETRSPNTPVQRQPSKIFSEEWAQSYQIVINNSMPYFHASTGWDAGALAFVMHASPEHGYPQPSAVVLDLHRGKCRAAHAMPLPEARSQANFVLEGDYDNWMKVLHGEAPPILMIIRNKLMLAKGSMFSLLPFTRSAQELVNCAQRVS